MTKQGNYGARKQVVHFARQRSTFRPLTSSTSTRHEAQIVVTSHSRFNNDFVLKGLPLLSDSATLISFSCFVFGARHCKFRISTILPRSSGYRVGRTETGDGMCHGTTLTVARSAFSRLFMQSCCNNITRDEQPGPDFVAS